MKLVRAHVHMLAHIFALVLRLILPLIFMKCTPAFADADMDSILIGDWQYDGFFYRDHRYPNPNPDLTVLFSFNSDHTHRLYWKRADETKFCERRGTWSIRGELLEQEVTWLNPDNDSSCAQDPDMQPHQTTQTRFKVDDHELGFYLNLDDQTFIYILKRIDANHIDANRGDKSGAGSNRVGH
jgi:hypothetical protein